MHLSKPEFSIIIPTYNRPIQLKQCLQSITQVDYPRDCFEVIVVDDGSAVSLDDEIAPFQNGFSLTLITQKNAGPATARNTGAVAARGRILVFTDDDCQLSKDWLRILSTYFDQDKGSTEEWIAVGGYTHNVLSDNIYSSASQLLIDYLYSHYNVVAGDANFMTSNNLAVPKAAFDTLNGFDESFPLAAAEDREFCDRWRTMGHRLIYAPEAIIHHAHRLTLRSFWRQQFNYGRGAFHFHHHCTRSKLQQKKRESWRFYLDLLCYPFVQITLLKAFPIAVLFLLSQIAVATGLLIESRQCQPEKSIQYS